MCAFLGLKHFSVHEVTKYLAENYFLPFNTLAVSQYGLVSMVCVIFLSAIAVTLYI